MSTMEIPYKFLVTDTPPERGNLTASVTSALRQAIVTLDLKPGEILDKGAICERLGVSRFPVSEAFSRLQAEGLVEIMPQRGTMVSRVKIADVVEFMLIRKALEGEAIRVIMAHPPEGIAEELERNLLEQGKAVKRGDRRTFHAFDMEFHEILFGTMNFSRIRAVVDSARANLDRARLLILDPRRVTASYSEHGVIARAITSGDTEGAVAAMRTHIDRVTAELLAFARTAPHLFADADRLDDFVALFD